jgi:hypothetical protein
MGAPVRNTEVSSSPIIGRGGHIDRICQIAPILRRVGPKHARLPDVPPDRFQQLGYASAGHCARAAELRLLIDQAPKTVQNHLPAPEK